MAKGRKDARTNINPEIATLPCYHGSRFEKLYFYNSDRKILLNDDHTVSEENPDGIKKLVKPGTHPKEFGIELEHVSAFLSGNIPVYINLMDLIFTKCNFDADFWRSEEDGTVDVESITQTFSKAWLRNNYKSIKAMYQMFEEFGITTNSERCGMHVNINLANFGNDYETAIENARKLGYVVNKHYDLMKIAFNRTSSRTTFCARMNCDKEYWKTNPIENFYNDHHCSFNLGHARKWRVELRLVGGQKNYACFRNTMETVFHLIDRVCKLKWDDLDDVTKLFSGCNSHVFDRLSTNCLDAGVISYGVVSEIRNTVKPERWL